MLWTKNRTFCGICDDVNHQEQRNIQEVRNHEKFGI